MNMPIRQVRGFTLIEVMVALAIVAIALAAGLRASGTQTRNAELQTSMLLAQLCAENELSRVRLASDLPGVGDSDLPCTQAGHALRVNLQVRPTLNPSFRRVDAQVSEGGSEILKLTTIVSRY